MGVLRKGTFFALVVAALLLTVVAVAPTFADAATPGVSASPRLDVMQVVDGEVLDSAVIGNRVVLVGTFTQVKNAGGNNVNQPYVAAYDINTGRLDGAFRPAFDKAAFAVDTDGTSLFVGGNFNAVNGEAHRKLAKLSASGNLISSFDPQVSANVNDVAIANGNVYLAGRFTSIDGQDRSGFAAVDASSGNVENSVDFDFTFSVASGGGISGKSIALTPDDSKLFLSHTARFIDGQERTAIARFDISANTASLSNWQTNLYDDELDRFGGALRPRRIAMSPDGSYFVMVTSGGDRPPAGDTAVRFPVNSGGNTSADWVSRHFDTVLGVAISSDSVYVGGHFQFQEAPGSTNPFPGDKFTNYGFGFGQGPAQLGSEVVARQQLGALDPATGKSLNWNPGSDSFLGVQSLTFVPGKGLLVGHDGDRLGGADIGRHALFPLGNDPVDPPPPGDEFACSVANDGTTAVLTFSGERGTSEQLRRNGRWAGSVTGQTTQRITNGVGDDFTVRVRGEGFAQPYSVFPCLTGGNPGGVTLDTSITSPTTGAVVEPGNIVLRGDASAPSGIRRVRLTVVRRSDGRYLNANGSLTTAWAAIDINLNTTDDERTWARTINLTQTGDYNLTAKTFSNDGDKDATRAESTFVVGSTADDPPTLVYSGPSTIEAGATTVIAGSATDDLGVSSVTFTLRERNANLYLQSDGTLGPSIRFTAQLTNPGATTTNWSLELPVPVGEWQITTDALDTSGQRFRRTRSFSRVGAGGPPSISIITGLDQSGAAQSRFNFAGEATAQAGLRSVEVLIRNPIDYSGLQTNGVIGTRASYFALPGNNVGTDTNWTYRTPALPAGTYDVFFRVTDSIGARSTSRTLLIVGPPGDNPPTALINGTTRFQQGLPSLNLTLTGTANDDSGVQAVAVGVFNNNNKQWLRPDGSFDTRPTPFMATLSSPQLTNTNWSLDFSPNAPGTYYFYVRAIDTSGQGSVKATFGSGRMYPGDALPTVVLALPTNNQTITTGRISATGRANDDNALDGVQLLIRNINTNQYLRRDGTLGSAQWIDAALTNPGADRSNWDYQTGTLPDGTWDVSARSVDRSDQTSVSTRIRVTLS